MSQPPANNSRATEREAMLRPGELARVSLAFAAFFLLLSSNYILRPVREEMGVQTGAEKLHWLFTGTFIATLLFVPIFGLVVRKLPRPWLVPAVYGFFVLNMIAFMTPFAIGITTTVAVAFFIWISVVNLCIVSLFWSNASDVFTTEEAKRLYGYISAGGTAGALAGPALTAVIAKHVGPMWLLVIAATALSGSALCCVALRRYSHGQKPQEQRPIGGSIIAGIRLTLQSPVLRGVALLVIFYTTVSTVLYVEQNAAVKALFSDSGERTSFFATVDLTVNCVALMMQLLFTRRIVKSFGLGWALAGVPLLVMIGLLSAGAWRGAVLIAVLQIIHRAGEFSLLRPAREMIYTTVDAESRYKAKNFIDTTIYRGNDAVASWLIALVRSSGLNAFLVAGVPAALLWLVTGWKVGRRYDRHQQA